MMKRAVFFIAAQLVFAQSESPEVKGKRIIQEAIQALGGDAFLTMKNRVEQGRAYSFYREKLTGLAVATFYTEYVSPQDVKAGEKLLTNERESYGKKEDAAIVFNGAEGYQITYRGTKRLPEDRLSRYRETNFNNILYIFRARLNEPGMIIEALGAEVLENAPVEKVSLTDSENREVIVYFHRSTKLPVKELFYRRDPLTKERIEEVTRFGKYRDIGGGVQWPFAVSRERDGEKVYEMYAETVKINQSLRPDLFKVPATP